MGLDFRWHGLLLIIIIDSCVLVYQLLLAHLCNSCCVTCAGDGSRGWNSKFPPPSLYSSSILFLGHPAAVLLEPRCFGAPLRGAHCGHACGELSSCLLSAHGISSITLPSADLPIHPSHPECITRGLWLERMVSLAHRQRHSTRRNGRGHGSSDRRGYTRLLVIARGRGQY